MKAEPARYHSFLWLALFSVVALSCTSVRSETSTPAQTVKKKNPLAVEVSDNLLKSLKIGTPSWKPVAQSMHAAARIEADGTRMARINSPVSGRITKILALEGQHVHAGEVLATIHSSQLSDAEFAFLKAYSQEQLAKRAVDRADKLLKADVIGSAEVLRRQAELDQATAEVAAARAQLRMLGAPEHTIDTLAKTGKIDSGANILASISGTVLQRKVTLGQIVQPAEPVFVIADLSNVWLVADIPEEASGSLAVGKVVEASVGAYPDTQIRGRLSFVSSIVSPETRTVQVRMNLPNPQHKYKPDMLATMTIEDPTKKQEVIPTTALVRNGNDDDVFVQTGPKAFLLTPVRLGAQVGNDRVLLGGIDPGKQIVTDGAFSLNNERQRLAQLSGE